ncbi:hypothetical protein KJ865_06495, partial [Myxococcota bacterium]|nr:hypothetical protein [Myxococcota bacterium]
MNYFLPVLVGLAVLSLAPDANARRNQAQQEGYVFKYKELPNVDFFKTDNFGYMDIGYTFNSTKVFGVPLWNSDVKWCGYVGREKNYIIITPAVVISRIAAYNREAKKHKWAPVDPAKVTNNREAWHALIAMYNNIGKASGKKFTPLDIKLPPKPTLPFWYRV